MRLQATAASCVAARAGHSVVSNVAFVQRYASAVAECWRVNRDPLFLRNRLVIVRQPIARFRLHLLNGRRHFHPGSNALQPTQNDPLRAVETLANDAQAVDMGPISTSLPAHLVVRVDDEHELLGLVVADRRIRHQNRFVLAAARKSQPREQTRRQR